MLEWISNITFDHIEHKYKLPRNSPFNFFQLRDYIKKDTTFSNNFTLHDIEKQLLPTEGKVSVDILYDILKEHGEVEICKRGGPGRKNWV